MSMTELRGQAMLTPDRYYYANVYAQYSVAISGIRSNLRDRAIEPTTDEHAWAQSVVGPSCTTGFLFEVSSPMQAEVAAYNIAQAAHVFGVSRVDSVWIGNLDGVEQARVAREASWLPNFGAIAGGPIADISAAAQSGAEAVQSVAKIPLYLAILGVVVLVGYGIAKFA